MASKDEKVSKSEIALRGSSEADKGGNSDLLQLQDLYALMLQENLDSLEVKDDELRIRLNRRILPPTSHATHSSSPRPESETPPAGDLPAEIATPEQPGITTPLAGIFYRAAAPTSAPFVKEGDIVDSGQTLCIIEAMKVMNEIKAESRCKISRILAENSRPVTAGQTLILVEPA